MPRGGPRPNSGGKRPGAGRKRTKPTMQVELSEQATLDLVYFIDDLALEPGLAPAIVSEILRAALSGERDRWAERFGNG